jgi:hypothetical protein
MLSRRCWHVPVGLVGLILTCPGVARAGITAVSRDSVIEATVVGDQTNLVDTKQTNTLDDFSAMASVVDDEHGAGSAFADQTSKLTIVNGQLRGFEVHGTSSAGGLDAGGGGRFHLVFEVPVGELWLLDTAGDGGGGGQSANGIAELTMVETTHNETQLHFLSGEFPVDFGERSLITPGRYDLLLTYESGGFSGAQADLFGTFTTNAVPLPPAAWSGIATLTAAAFFMSWRRVRVLAVGECRQAA